MSTGYFLKLEQFEGPLDLLLHLIRVNEIDIFNIDIYLLTTKYLEHLRLMSFRDLTEAGDFLEMAASLIEIKSRQLLPVEEKKGASDEIDEEDPAQALQNRLIEYERFRNASSFFHSLPQMGVEIQTNSEWRRLEPKYDHIEAPLTGDPASMVLLYEQMLRDMAERKPVSVVEAKTHLVTVEEKIDELQRLLDTMHFALFQGFYKKFKSRYELVVYILAVLELAKWNKVKVYQQVLLGPLWVYRADLDVSQLPLSEQDRKRIIEDVTSVTAEASSASAEA